MLVVGRDRSVRFCLRLFSNRLNTRHAYHELDLTMKSGVYGSTFFMLTGFHGFHVTMGATMLLVILVQIDERVIFQRKITSPLKVLPGIGTLLMWFGWVYMSLFIGYR